MITTLYLCIFSIGWPPTSSFFSVLVALASSCTKLDSFYLLTPLSCDILPFFITKLFFLSESNFRTQNALFHSMIQQIINYIMILARGIRYRKSILLARLYVRRQVWERLPNILSEPFLAELRCQFTFLTATNICFVFQKLAFDWHFSFP